MHLNRGHEIVKGMGKDAREQDDGASLEDRRFRIAAIPILALLASGIGYCAFAFVQAARFRGPLEWYMGSGWRVWTAATALSAGIGIAALVLVAWRAVSRGGGVPLFATLRLALYVAIAHLILFASTVHPFRRIFFDFSVAVAFGAFALLLLVGGPIVRALPHRVVRATDLALMNLCVIVVGAELALRGLALVRPSPVFTPATSGVEERLRQNRFASGTLRYGFPCNSAGHYDSEFLPKRPGTPRVVAIGDSFSASVVPHYHHFTTVAERELPGIEVYNMGVPGIGVLEYLHLLRDEALPLEPDLVVVNLFVGNDLRPPNLPPRRDRLLRSWYDKEEILLNVVPRRLVTIAREKRAMEGTEGAGTSPQETAGAALLLGDDPEGISEAFPWVDDWRKEPPAMSEEALLRNEIHGARDAWATSADPYPALFSVFRDIEATADGARLAFLIIPSRFQVEEDWRLRVADVIPATGSDPDYPQERLARWFEERGIPYLDLLPVLLRVPPLEDGRRHLFRNNDTHFNVRGNEVTGRELARFLEPILAGER
jgi:hypothetical protein